MVIEFNGNSNNCLISIPEESYIIKVMFMKILILNMEKERIQLEDVALLWMESFGILVVVVEVVLQADVRFVLNKNFVTQRPGFVI